MILLVPAIGIIIGAALFALIAGLLALFGVIVAAPIYILLAFLCGTVGLIITLGVSGA